MTEYERWIVSRNLPACPAGLCHGEASLMAARFPELRLVRGHYEPWADDRKKYPHWWCVAPDGTVVDPTAAQFVGVGPGEYVEHHGDEPTGRCLQCGLYVFNRGMFCDSSCSRAFNDDIAAIVASGPPMPISELHERSSGEGVPDVEGRQEHGSRDEAQR